MRNKLFTFFAVIAALLGFVHQQLEAVSQIPSLLAVELVKGEINSVVLSTNTLSMNIDEDIYTSTTTAPSNQLIGYIEWNATKQNTTDGTAVMMTQLEQWASASSSGAPTEGNFGAFRLACGGEEDTRVDYHMYAIQIYSNVVSTAGAGTDSIAYQDPTLVSATKKTGTDLWYANLKEVSALGSTFCGWTGVLAFYVVDDLHNDTASSGTYNANFQFSIGTPN